MLCVLLLAPAGCLTPRVEPDVADPDPSVKVPAIRAAAAAGDRSAVGPLIDDLASDDAAVRLFAAEGLRRIAGGDTGGEDFGYRPYDPPDARAAAVARWRQWHESHGAAGGNEHDPNRPPD